MKTIMDPERARAFASFLDERSSELKTLNARASGQLNELHLNHWQDEKYEQFEKRFDEASRLLQTFLEHSDKYADYLRRKAIPIERYLGRRT